MGFPMVLTCWACPGGGPRGPGHLPGGSRGGPKASAPPRKGSFGGDSGGKPVIFGLFSGGPGILSAKRVSFPGKRVQNDQKSSKFVKFHEKTQKVPPILEGKNPGTGIMSENHEYFSLKLIAVFQHSRREKNTIFGVYVDTPLGPKSPVSKILVHFLGITLKNREKMEDFGKNVFFFTPRKHFGTPNDNTFVPNRHI